MLSATRQNLAPSAKPRLPVTQRACMRWKVWEQKGGTGLKVQAEARTEKASTQDTARRSIRGERPAEHASASGTPPESRFAAKPWRHSAEAAAESESAVPSTIAPSSTRRPSFGAMLLTEEALADRERAASQGENVGGLRVSRGLSGTAQRLPNTASEISNRHHGSFEGSASYASEAALRSSVSWDARLSNDHSYRLSMGLDPLAEGSEDGDGRSDSTGDSLGVAYSSVPFGLHSSALKAHLTAPVRSPPSLDALDHPARYALSESGPEHLTTASSFQPELFSSQPPDQASSLSDSSATSTSSSLRAIDSEQREQGSTFDLFSSRSRYIQALGPQRPAELATSVAPQADSGSQQAQADDTAAQTAARGSFSSASTVTWRPSPQSQSSMQLFPLEARDMQPPPDPFGTSDSQWDAASLLSEGSEGAEDPPEPAAGGSPFDKRSQATMDSNRTKAYEFAAWPRDQDAGVQADPAPDVRPLRGSKVLPGLGPPTTQLLSSICYCPINESASKRMQGLLQGQFSSKALTGVGTFTAHNGTSYEGQWRNSTPHGFGVARRPGHAIFLGSFRSGLLHGPSMITYAEGHSYAGETQQGLRHGHGLLQMADGSHYAGSFLQGVRSGPGTYSYIQGDCYWGSWHSDSMQGLGVYQHKDGAIYEGMWHLGQRHGWGVLTGAAGSMSAGLWQSGILRWQCPMDKADAELATLSAEAIDLAQETARSARRVARKASALQRTLKDPFGPMQGDLKRSVARAQDAAAAAREGARLATDASRDLPTVAEEE
ncbi:hypothetical protein WJX73_006589 [Symbiochloris irregularis]|uniref:Uncharacterized protein n=1 Tax=Symbiochloris irregularis TaxID=706552 RepID=A0AAW1PIR3_9CHLO